MPWEVCPKLHQYNKRPSTGHHWPASKQVTDRLLIDALRHTPSKQLLRALRDSGSSLRYSSKALILLHLANMSDTPTTCGETQYREEEEMDKQHLVYSGIHLTNTFWRIAWPVTNDDIINRCITNRSAMSVLGYMQNYTNKTVEQNSAIHHIFYTAIQVHCFTCTLNQAQSG